MAKQTINVGTTANDKRGDPLRTAFTKINQNFTELYNIDANTASDVADLTDNSNLLFSGNYEDLANTPFIPTDLSDLTDNSNLLFSGNYDDLENKPSVPSDISDLTDTQNLLNPPLTTFTNIVLTNSAFIIVPGENFFEKEDYATGNSAIDTFVLEGGYGGVGITRGDNGGIYDPYREESFDENLSPDGILWNLEGWDDLSNIQTRTFIPFYQAYESNLDNNVPGSKALIHIPDYGKYYAIEWLSWTPNNNGGGFSYNRYEIDENQIQEGIRFADGTVQTTAFTLNPTVHPYIELTDTPLIVLPSVLGQSVSFSKSPNTSNADFIDIGLTLARGVNGDLFNLESEEEYDDNLHLSPAGTRWNADGWGDLSNIATRTYGTLRSVLNNAIGNNILAAELVMHDTINDKYYEFNFTSWTQNNAGGGFAYTRTLIENPNFFKKDNYATGNNAIDVFVADDGEGSGIAITRDVNQGIYNPFREEDWSSSTSPAGTLWNTDGWDKDDLGNIETRTYDNFDDAYNGNLGNNVPGTKAIMYIPDTDEYYAIHWLSWTQNAEGGGFSYLRYKIDTTKFNEEGIAFADGSVLKSAEGVGRVKLRSPGRRRIEEAYGYNEVAVTAVNTINLTTLASRNGVDENVFWIDSSNTTIDDIIGDTGAAEIVDETSIQFSLDNSTWYTFSGSISTVNNEKGYGVTLPEGQLLNYDAGDTIYFRYDAGGVPVEWWSKDDLPGGAANFRGAVIDYHAYTGDSTWIGTIHIVDDDGEDHIAHTEVQSGSDDGENDDLWYVTTEGRIQYRRIDGAAKLLKVQWGAKVFYGSEYWD
jgi:hypothetical protein